MLLQGIPGLAVYIDDILITGQNSEVHLKSLEEVLRHLERAELHAKIQKCIFMAPSVSYLGYVIDAQGLHPQPDKIQAIEDAPKHKNVTELKSYMGLLSNYEKFLPNRAQSLTLLYKLLGHDTKWEFVTSSYISM